MDVTGAVLLVVGLILGGGVGLAAGAALARARTGSAGTDIGAPEQARTAAELARTAAERDAERASALRLRTERDALAERAGVTESELAAARAVLESERAAAQERLDLLRVEQERLVEQFTALSADALRHNNEAFLTLADERFKAAQQANAAELEQRREAVAHLVKPIEQHLERVATQIDDSERRRAQAFTTLTEQVRQMGESGALLRRETEQLKTALRRPEIRGSWGEHQLRKVVELAGMVEHCDFVTQHTVVSDDGKRRPDLVVNLTGGRRLVVDAKVSISAFYDALNAADEATRATRLAAHAKHVRAHVDQLASKAYWSLVTPSPEFVIAFVPGEAMLAQALETDPALIEHAAAKGVVLASPLTLIATLRTAAYAWKEAKLAENAQRVFDEGRGLYKRLGTMGDHLDRLGRSLTGSVKAYNQAVGSLERQVLPSARRLHEMDVADSPLSAPTPVDEPVRPLSAAELVTAADERRHVRALPSRPVVDPDPRAAGPDEVETDSRYGVEPLPLDAVSTVAQPNASRLAGADGA